MVNERERRTVRKHVVLLLDAHCSILSSVTHARVTQRCPRHEQQFAAGPLLKPNRSLAQSTVHTHDAVHWQPVVEKRTQQGTP